MAPILEAATLTAIGLVAYHHAGYPALLTAIGRSRKAQVEAPNRGYAKRDDDASLPSVTVLVPAYNEEAVIGEKIANVLAMDYPADKLNLRVVCDGCSDDTYGKAMEAALFDSDALNRVTVVNCLENRGKTAVLNDEIHHCSTDLVALTDASSIIALDGLLRIARHFADPKVGAVSGTYRLLNPQSAGESSYWHIQTRQKAAESRLGGLIGAHGAFYVIRTSAFEPMPTDTINDDFIIPMRIAAQGMRTIYDDQIETFELEGTAVDADSRRRRRIGAGNMQQAIRLAGMLNPAHKGLAFAFFSGKFLRAFMPFILLLALAGSVALAPSSPLFALLATGQCAGYGMAAAVHLSPLTKWPGLCRKVHYIVMAHVSNGIGALEYLAQKRRGPWRRVSA